MLAFANSCGLSSTYRRSLDNGGSLNDLLLVHLGARTVEVTDDGGHTGLVAHGRGEVDGLLGVILGEAASCSASIFLRFDSIYSPLHLSTVSGGTLARQEGKRACRDISATTHTEMGEFRGRRTVPRGFVLPVTPVRDQYCILYSLDLDNSHPDLVSLVVEVGEFQSLD